MFKSKKVISCVSVIVALLMVSIIYVYATEYWGTSTSYTAGSYSARHASYMNVMSNSISARTIINSASGTLPPGYMGVFPAGYYSNGTLADVGGWTYTDTNSTGIDSYVNLTGISGYLYSKGMTALWNGYSYTTKVTTASPNAQGPSSATTISAQVNSSGQSFGSATNASSVEDEPDLILAEGVDGTQGYVKRSELYGDMPKSPEEAVKMMKEKTEKSIPLYDSEGKTVISEFKITPPDKNNIKTINK